MSDPTSSINLNLPAVPEIASDNPELYMEVLRIYNAIKSVAVGVDAYTQDGLIGLEVTIVAATLGAQIIQLRNELASLKEHLVGLGVVNWAQPGDIGSTTPSSVAATTLTASGDTTLAKLGINGKPASAAITLPANGTDLATTQALANAMKNLLITFGLGA